MVTHFRNTTNYIVLIRGKGIGSKFVVMDCNELEGLLWGVDAEEDLVGEAIQGTLAFYAMPDYPLISVREYQGGEVDLGTFLVSPSVQNEFAR